MAIRDRTLIHVAGMRIAVAAAVDAHAQDLLTGWARAWSEMDGAWRDAIDDLVSASADGRWPSRAKILKARRARLALDQTEAALDQLVKEFRGRVSRDIRPLAGEAASWSARIIASQYPDVAGPEIDLSARFDRVDTDALDAIVRRSIQQVTALSRPITPQAMAALRAELVRGVALGVNPRAAASRLLARLGGAFDGGRNRALVIMRTEMLDAARAANRAQELANRDVLDGWLWTATLDARTCPGCWGMHGTEHALDESGPDDHQQGRCARVPMVKPWRDLGYSIPEPASLMPDAETTFAALTPAEQAAILGDQRLALWQSGKLAWTDLAQRRATDGWRDSWVPTPVATLLAKAQ